MTRMGCGSTNLISFPECKLTNENGFSTGVFWPSAKPQAFSSSGQWAIIVLWGSGTAEHNMWPPGSIMDTIQFVTIGAYSSIQAFCMDSCSTLGKRYLNRVVSIGIKTDIFPPCKCHNLRFSTLFLILFPSVVIKWVVIKAAFYLHAVSCHQPRRESSLQISANWKK